MAARRLASVDSHPDFAAGTGCRPVELQRNGPTRHWRDGLRRGAACRRTDGAALDRQRADQHCRRNGPGEPLFISDRVCERSKISVRIRRYHRIRAHFPRHVSSCVGDGRPVPVRLFDDARWALHAAAGLRRRLPASAPVCGANQGAKSFHRRPDQVVCFSCFGGKRNHATRSLKISELRMVASPSASEPG